MMYICVPVPLLALMDKWYVLESSLKSSHSDNRGALAQGASLCARVAGDTCSDTLARTHGIGTLLSHSVSLGSVVTSVLR